MEEHYVTIGFIAHMFKVPIRTLYRWASQDQWDRTSPRHYPVRYRYADACDSAIKRETPAT